MRGNRRRRKCHCSETTREPSIGFLTINDTKWLEKWRYKLQRLTIVGARSYKQDQGCLHMSDPFQFLSILDFYFRVHWSVVPCSMYHSQCWTELWCVPLWTSGWRRGVKGDQKGEGRGRGTLKRRGGLKKNLKRKKGSKEWHERGFEKKMPTLGWTICCRAGPTKKWE